MLLSSRGALVIAQRLSTIQDADEILVVHQGAVHKRGTHEELLSKGGLYARLYASPLEGQSGQTEAWQRTGWCSVAGAAAISARGRPRRLPEVGRASSRVDPKLRPIARVQGWE